MRNPTQQTKFEKWPHTGAVFCNVINSRITRNTSVHDVKKLELTCQMLSQVCSQVVLIGNYDFLPESLLHLKYVSTNLINKGPIGCLEALLSSGIDTEYILTPCDVGIQNIEIFKLLTDCHIKPPAILTYPYLPAKATPQFPPSIDLIDQPLISKYSVKSLPKIREQIIKNDLSMHRLAQLGEATRVVVPRELIYNEGPDSPIPTEKIYHLN
ncbi:MAG: hypothetical protein AB7S78_07115 [Candidatus Omnitrophota bacterium]